MNAHSRPASGIHAAHSRRTILSASAVAVAATLTASGTATAADLRPAQPHEEHPPGEPIAPQEPDPQLRALLAEVDEKRIEDSVRRLARFGTRHTLSNQDDPERGIGAARDWLFAEMRSHAEQSQGRMTVELQSYLQEPANRIPETTRITNVVATIRGTNNPERVHVISGHYDSRASDPMDAASDAPGADDDASGVAVVLELARLLARAPLESTVVLAAVAGEEQGLYGSAHMAEQFAAAGTDVRAMFTDDIVGTGKADDGTADPRTVRLFAEGVPTSETPEQGEIRRAVGGENDSTSRQLARFVTDVASGTTTGMRVRVIYRRDRFLRGGDHIPFLERAYPAARFTEPHEDYRHQHQDVRTEDGVQYGDLPEFCDFSYIAGVARVNLAAAWSLAQAPGAPTGVVIRTAELTNDTELVWERGPEPDLAGYEVVWRETTAADWTHSIDVGDTTTAVVDLSKDNVFFGVRAIDREGHRSPVSFPAPQRE